MSDKTHLDVYNASAFGRLSVSEFSDWRKKSKKKMEECSSDDLDAVYPEETVEESPELDPKYWLEPHPYEDNPELPGEDCMCGAPADSEIHIAVAIPAVAEEEDEEEMPETIIPREPAVLLAHAYDQPEDGTAPCLVCDRDILETVHEGYSPILASAVEDDVKTVKFRIPILIPSGGETGDGRSFASGALTSRDVPLPLRFQLMSSEGHNQSVVVGRIDHVEVSPEGGIINVTGVFDTGKYAQEAIRQCRNGMMRGVSADLDKFNASVLSSPEPDKIAAQQIQVDEARLSGATIVAIPAFSEAFIEVLDEDLDIQPGEHMEETEETLVASALCSSVPVEPPASWFENPNLAKPTHLTITDEGRVYGHIAAFNTSHSGLPYGPRPPRSASKYAYFRTGVVRTQEGQDIRVGQMTLSGGHASLSLSARDAVKHYDDTNSAVCDLAAGEDQHGIWVSGALRPGLSPEKVRAFRAASPSGDWRPINGKLELVAVCAVNVPGFPVASAMVAAGGMVTALVAAGTAPLMAERDSRFAAAGISTEDIAQVVRTTIDLDAKAQAAFARIEPTRAAKAAELAIKEQTALERINARKAELSLAAEAVTARVASLRYTPPFDENKHPRDDHGKFRKVLARLNKALEGKDASPEEKEAVQDLERAVEAEDAGDNDKAKAEADKAVSALEKGGSSEASNVKATLDRKEGEAETEKGGGKHFTQLPAEIKEILEKIALTEGENSKAHQVVHQDKPLSVDEIANIIETYLERLLLPAGLPRVR